MTPEELKQLRALLTKFCEWDMVSEDWAASINRETVQDYIAIVDWAEALTSYHETNVTIKTNGE